MTTMIIRMNAARSDVTIEGRTFEFNHRIGKERGVVCDAIKATLGLNVEQFKPRRHRRRRHHRKEAA